MDAAETMAFVALVLALVVLQKIAHLHLSNDALSFTKFKWPFSLKDEVPCIRGGIIAWNNIVWTFNHVATCIIVINVQLSKVLYKQLPPKLLSATLARVQFTRNAYFSPFSNNLRTSYMYLICESKHT